MRILIEGFLTPTRAEIERLSVVGRGEFRRLLVDAHPAYRISGHTNASSKVGSHSTIGLRFPIENRSPWAWGHSSALLPRSESCYDPPESVRPAA